MTTTFEPADVATISVRLVVTIILAGTVIAVVCADLKIADEDNECTDVKNGQNKRWHKIFFETMDTINQRVQSNANSLK